MKILEENGWYELKGRGKGSHRIYRHDHKGCVTVPGNLNADMPLGTENSILRKAGLK
ncbi:MAG: type II toxin-antitoxin system HicA family toxin [Tannerellaceae bacterium]